MVTALLAEEPAQQVQKAERRAESVKAVAEDADVSYSLPDVVSMKEAAQQVKPGLPLILWAYAMPWRQRRSVESKIEDVSSRVGSCCMVISARGRQHKDAAQHLKSGAGCAVWGKVTAT